MSIFSTLAYWYCTLFLGRRKCQHLQSHSHLKPFIGKQKKRHWTLNESLEHIVVVLKTLSFVMRRLHHLPFHLALHLKRYARIRQPHHGILEGKFDFFSWKEEVCTFTVSFSTETIHRETEEKALNLEWKYRTCSSSSQNTFFCNA